MMCMLYPVSEIFSIRMLQDMMIWLVFVAGAGTVWLILGHYSPVIPTGRLRPVKTVQKAT